LNAKIPTFEGLFGSEGALMSDAEEVWRRRSDEQLAEAAARLEEYTDKGRRVICAELVRRGITVSAQAVDTHRVAVGPEPTSKECPKCGLFNPGVAERCDCGFDFLTKRIALSYARPTDENVRAEQGMTLTQVGLRNIEVGVTISIVGIIVDIALAMATDMLRARRVVLIPWGAMAAGLAIVFRGIGQYQRGKKLDR
jgi:hypothetical protein